MLDYIAPPTFNIFLHLCNKKGYWDGLLSLWSTAENLPFHYKFHCCFTLDQEALELNFACHTLWGLEKNHDNIEFCVHHIMNTIKDHMERVWENDSIDQLVYERIHRVCQDQPSAFHPWWHTQVVAMHIDLRHLCMRNFITLTHTFMYNYLYGHHPHFQTFFTSLMLEICSTKN